MFAILKKISGFNPIFICGVISAGNIRGNQNMKRCGWMMFRRQLQKRVLQNSLFIYLASCMATSIVCVACPEQSEGSHSCTFCSLLSIAKVYFDFCAVDNAEYFYFSLYNPDSYFYFMNVLFAHKIKVCP